MIEQGLVDRRRTGQHGDALVLHGPHGLLGIECELRDQRRAGLQAREDAGLVAEIVEERVDAQVAVVAGDLAACRPCRRCRQRLPVRAQHAFAASGGAGREQDVADVVFVDRRCPGVDSIRLDRLGASHELGPSQHVDVPDAGQCGVVVDRHPHDVPKRRERVRRQ
jgi:hypothetical protein